MPDMWDPYALGFALRNIGENIFGRTNAVIGGAEGALAGAYDYGNQALGVLRNMPETASASRNYIAAQDVANVAGRVGRIGSGATDLLAGVSGGAPREKPFQGTYSGSGFDFGDEQPDDQSISLPTTKAQEPTPEPTSPVKTAAESELAKEKLDRIAEFNRPENVDRRMIDVFSRAGKGDMIRKELDAINGGKTNYSAEVRPIREQSAPVQKPSSNLGLPWSPPSADMETPAQKRAHAMYLKNPRSPADHEDVMHAMEDTAWQKMGYPNAPWVDQSTMAALHRMADRAVPAHRNTGDNNHDWQAYNARQREVAQLSKKMIDDRYTAMKTALTQHGTIEEKKRAQSSKQTADQEKLTEKRENQDNIDRDKHIKSAVDRHDSYMKEAAKGNIDESKIPVQFRTEDAAREHGIRNWEKEYAATHGKEHPSAGRNKVFGAMDSFHTKASSGTMTQADFDAIEKLDRNAVILWAKQNPEKFAFLRKKRLTGGK